MIRNSSIPDNGKSRCPNALGKLTHCALTSKLLSYILPRIFLSFWKTTNHVSWWLETLRLFWSSWKMFFSMGPWPKIWAPLNSQSNNKLIWTTQAERFQNLRFQHTFLFYFRIFGQYFKIDEFASQQNSAIAISKLVQPIY